MDDMPDLEDCTEDLKKIRIDKEEEGEIKVKVLNTEMKKEEVQNQKPEFKFKKGFFLKNNNDNIKTEQKSDVVDLSHIKSNVENTTKEKLVSNVKNEIKNNNSSDSKSILNDIVNQKDDWVNKELLERISKKPNLFKYFMDPRFSSIIQLMQSDPQKAMSQYGNIPEFRIFMQEFSEIMAEHFTKLGNEQKSKDNNNTFNGTKIEDKEVNEILMDEKVQTIIKKLQTEGKLDVNEIDKDNELKKKIKVLIDKGLFKVQRESDL